MPTLAASFCLLELFFTVANATPFSVLNLQAFVVFIKIRSIQAEILGGSGTDRCLMRLQSKCDEFIHKLAETYSGSLGGLG